MDEDDGGRLVAYHEHTVAGRGDDPVANALGYYASRGETPMFWGGSGAVLLGLEGEVDMADWRAALRRRRRPSARQRRASGGLRAPGHGAGGQPGQVGRRARGHRPGRRHARHPGRRDRRHSRHTSTRSTTEQGGRRGRAQVRTGTGGLTWAVSRHATTRGGDPQLHDHVLT